MTTVYRADLKIIATSAVLIGLLISVEAFGYAAPITRILIAGIAAAVFIGTIGFVAYLFQSIIVTEQKIEYRNYTRRYEIDLAAVSRIGRGSTIKALPFKNAICFYPKAEFSDKPLCIGTAVFSDNTIGSVIADVKKVNPTVELDDDIRHLSKV